MRCSHRNKQAFWYALYTGMAEGYDDSMGYHPSGNQISAYATYGKPVQTRGNISAVRGTVIPQKYGREDEYDRTVLLSDINTPIDEQSVLWIDVVPTLDVNGYPVLDENGRMVTPWDHIVTKVARGRPGFGPVRLQVRRVSVS